MTVSLERIFPVRHLSALQDPLDQAIGGFVFVMSHWDGLERYHNYSVNHRSENGDTGWQSSRIYSPDQADAAAEVLADFCHAEVVWP